ncbi:MAG TPA: SRPBCC family protein [Candidatus Saccharimonadales bacterium]|nr:SRPBCC family protein [Candidatus Saccharimonadales bacterium]
MQDSLTREITVKAPKERVYNAIADADQITTWFPDAVEEGTLAVGERPFLRFGNFKTRIYIEAARPFDYFAYRWVPGGIANTGDVLKVPNTLVEFFIEELAEGTKVTLKESGFASLPADVAQQSFDMVSGGWNEMMVRLEEKLNKA